MIGKLIKRTCQAATSDFFSRLCSEKILPIVNFAKNPEAFVEAEIGVK